MRVFVGMVGLLLVSAGVGSAQTQPRWAPVVRIRSEVRYDNNPFLLDSVRKERVGAPSAGDLANGRFRDMESAADVIAIPSVELGAQGAGIAGRPLTLSADVAYETNVRNAARRHAEAQFSVEQALRRGGGVRISADWRPTYFHKNYLADAVDLNLDGNIASAERVYGSAKSHEIDLGIRYRQRLLKQTDRRTFGMTADVEADYLDRRYDAPFDGRSRRGPGAGADLMLQVGPVITTGISYAVSSLTGDPALAVLILDENEFGVDFNGNLTTTDPNARADVMVDFSRVERQLGASIRADVGSATLQANYGRRTRRFGSTQPYDIVNRLRRDVLNEIGVDAEVRVTTGLRVEVGVQRGSQTTNRAGDPGSAGDVADYDRTIWSAGIRYRF